MFEQRSNIIVDLNAIKNNVKTLKNIIQPKAKLMAVVKADGYGHGSKAVSSAALASGAEILGVATAIEAINLRNYGITADILVLGATLPHYIDDCVFFGITQTVFEYETSVLISESAKKQNRSAVIHIKIETGMNRIGMECNDNSILCIEKIFNLENIIVEGIYSHFAQSDSADLDYALLQGKRFVDFCKKLEIKKILPKIKHICNSAAILALPEFHFDMVRAGIAIYGLAPSDIFDMDEYNIISALSFTTCVEQVKTIDENESVGYSRTFYTSEKTTIATIPIGYADGYPRLLSNVGYVLINGAPAKIIGNICMDQLMVDVTNNGNVNPGDEVVLIGKQKDNIITADDIAKWANTIHYEIICAVGRRSTRLYK